MESNKQVASRSFTLVEMLVVVAIICVLAGLLMPALHKAMDTARATSCANNLRMVATATSMYRNDNDNYIILVGYGLTPFDVWSDILCGIGSYPHPVYLDKASLLCPAESEKTYSSRFRTYGLYRGDYDIKYASLGFTFMKRINDRYLFYRAGAIPSPSNFVLYADNATASHPTLSFDKKPFWVFSPSAYIESAGVHTLHPGEQANVSFVDGHCAPADPDKLARTTNPIKYSVSSTFEQIILP